MIEELKKLPGIGPKMAQRMAFHILKKTRQEAVQLANAIVDARNKTTYCSICYSITEQNPCKICSDPKRNHCVICVVEDPYDLLSIEKTGEYRGSYHVLNGNLSPLDGIGPDKLTIGELITRIKKGGVREVILATNPTVVGDTTAMYIARELKPFNINVTRIARGLPVGGDLEYIDVVTLVKALEGRTVI